MEQNSLETIAKTCRNKNARLVDFQSAIETAGRIITYCTLEIDKPETKHFCPMQGERLKITVEGKTKLVYLCKKPGNYDG